MDALTTSLRLRVNHNQFCTIYHIFLDQYYILNHMSLLYKKKSYESILLKNNHISLYSFGRWKYVITSAMNNAAVTLKSHWHTMLIDIYY
jgi:hypothetical protein